MIFLTNNIDYSDSLSDYEFGNRYGHGNSNLYESGGKGETIQMEDLRQEYLISIEDGVIFSNGIGCGRGYRDGSGLGDDNIEI